MRPESGQSKARVLADDNADMRDYLRRIPAGTIASRRFATDRTQIIRFKRPDLVLAGVMMPKLDGFGLRRFAATSGSDRRRWFCCRAGGRRGTHRGSALARTVSGRPSAHEVARDAHLPDGAVPDAARVRRAFRLAAIVDSAEDAILAVNGIIQSCNAQPSGCSAIRPTS
jgi:hypothetical protein